MAYRSFDAIDVCARVVQLPLHGMKRAKIAPAATFSDAEIRGTAHMLGCGILGTLWQLRNRRPDWNAVSSAWNAASKSAAGDVDRRLFGEFDPKDQITLLGDNENAFDVRDKLYDEARHTIDLATYYIQSDEAGRRTARGLFRARERGVRVRLIADEYIVRKKEYQQPGVMRLLDELRRAGVEIVLWRDRSRPYDASHRKILLVDGQTLIVGGRNIADHYARPGWRDVELMVQGPSAALAAPLFERTFRCLNEPHWSESTERGFLLATMPADIASHANVIYLLQCINAAKHTIDIENAYYLGHPALVGHLRAALRRGVRIRLFTNSAESNDLDFANYRLYASLLEVFDVGVELFLRRGQGKTLHCKYFVVDGEWVSLGSSNLDYYSPRYCTEANVHVRSAQLARDLTAWFEDGISSADRISNASTLESVLRAQQVSRAIDLLLHDLQ